jgi:hypothetical protein
MYVCILFLCNTFSEEIFNATDNNTSVTDCNTIADKNTADVKGVTSLSFPGVNAFED